MSLKILKNANCAEYTSWLVGGSAEYICFPENEEQLKEALQYSKQNQLPITVLGGGSNVLISDDGILGLTICLRRFSQISHEVKNDRLLIECLSGTAKSELLKLFLKYKLAPALFLAGLPGDVGGGVVMNAGVAESFYPREFMELVNEIEVIGFDGEVKTFKSSDLQVTYRHTEGWQPGIVTKVKISWPLQIEEDILQRVREANKTRLTKQPLDMPSCGSVFKNPENAKAAQLIDQCGLKGFQIGDAQVSLKHANFIVNLGHAKAADIWNVILHVQKTVWDQKGIQLKTEVVRLGRW